MPIRMTKDGDGEQRQDHYPGDGGSGGGGRKLPGGNLIGMLLPLLLRNPKLLIIVLILGAVFYFFSGNLLQDNATLAQLGLGCSMNEAVYDKAEVFEPLSDNAKNPLPERISLASYAPDRLNQGVQGSCVAWASAYAARTILEARSTGKSGNEVAFSPSYLYNQVALENCQGAYVPEAMKVMQQEGLVPFNTFPYDEQNCNRQPGNNLKDHAGQYRIKGYNRLTKGGDNYKTDMLGIKQHLAQGAPVVIGMMVGGSFMQGMMGQEVWIPERSDYDMAGFGGHAMCVVGYDDYKEGGAFQVMNSWGPEWGENGIGWIRYKDFDYFTKEAYGIYPVKAAAETLAPEEFSVSFGLMENSTGELIPLTKRSSISCQTSKPVAKGTKFKVEVTNNAECYTYVFGQETDGSSYTLFPYTPKHSPYCGITGSRLFPKDYSMQADEVGNKDVMAVLVSRQPIDYKALQEKMAASSESGLLNKLRKALGNTMAQTSITSIGNNLQYTGNLPDDNVLVMVIEVDKY